jgi:membrane protein YdbS with pleckstrin-like domain
MADMPFSNETIIEQKLPDIQAMLAQTLSVKYAPVNRLINLMATLILVLLVSTAYFQPWIQLTNNLNSSLPFIIWSLALIGLMNVLYSHLADVRKTFALRELDLNYSSGLFFRKTISQPITRIQHIELKSGPIERYIGLATLQVFSAGGATHTFEIPGLEVDTAQKLRQFILQHKDVVKHG